MASWHCRRDHYIFLDKITLLQNLANLREAKKEGGGLGILTSANNARDVLRDGCLDAAGGGVRCTDDDGDALGGGNNVLGTGQRRSFSHRWVSFLSELSASVHLSSWEPRGGRAE